MNSEEQLRARLRKIAALFEGATTAGERNAAAAAMGRISQSLGAMLDQTLWPEYVELRAALNDYLNDATERIFGRKFLAMRRRRRSGRG